MNFNGSEPRKFSIPGAFDPESTLVDDPLIFDDVGDASYLYDQPRNEPTPCSHNDDARNLVLSVDGTANQFGAKNTNVIEMHSRLVKDRTQRTFYNSGIGTYAKPTLFSFTYLKQFLFHTIDMAIAWNFERIVHEAYEWLSENYEPGDRIYLFGFSRGAYQVRVIAGMIHKVGLLHKGNKNQISFAYELYASVTDATTRDRPHASTSSTTSPGSSTANEHDLCAQFKRTLCHPDVRVHFVGAWDTVSSIGILRGQSLPETVTGMGHVCAFRHALALDEKRVKFQPEYVNGGLGPLPGDTGNVKEVWFPGTHSDIGGGNRLNANLSNFGPSLRWMMYEAMGWGLRLTRYEGQWMVIHPKESLKGVWNVFERLPIPSLSYVDKDSITWRPHGGRGRRIQPGQLIHESVFNAYKISSDATDSPYIPAADPPKGVSSWDELLEGDPSYHSRLVEEDSVETLTHTLNALMNAYQDGQDPSTIATSITTLRTYLHDGTRLSSALEFHGLSNMILHAINTINYSPGSETQDTQCLNVLGHLLAYAPSIPPDDRVFSTLNIKAWSSLVHRACSLDVKRIFESFCDPRITVHDYTLQGGLPAQVYAVSLPSTGLQVFREQSPPVSLPTSPSAIEMNNADMDPPQVRGDLLYYHRDIENPRINLADVAIKSNLVCDIAVFSPDGSLFIAATKSTQLATVFEARTGVSVDQIPHPISGELDLGDVSTLSVSDDNRHVVFGTNNGFIHLFDRRTRKARTQQCSTFSIQHLLSHDIDAIISHSSSGVTLSNFQDESQIDFSDSLRVSTLTSCRATSLIVGGSSSGVMNVWRFDRPTVLHSISTPHRDIQALAFRRDGLALASSERLSGNVKVWCCKTWMPLLNFSVDYSVSSLTFSFDGMDLVVAGVGCVTVFDADRFNGEDTDVEHHGGEVRLLELCG
ncbi:hypothetical protein ONZ45_g11119 [Pleurotus djamor]|nr:hypothetical protein ONZ45_g11119 [Pleurotus djamor]